MREGEDRVRKQTELIAELARDGHPIAEAQALHETMRKTLALMQAQVEELENRPT